MNSAAKVLVTIVCLSSCSWTQQASARGPASSDDVQRLFVAMEIRQRTQVLLDDSRKQSRGFLVEFLLKQLPGAGDKKDQVQTMVDEMLAGIYSEYPIDSILQDMVPIYQRHLTTADVDALVSFYSTPAGRKMLRELPAILSESNQIAFSRLQPRLQAAVVKLTERLTDMIALDQSKSK